MNLFKKLKLFVARRLGLWIDVNEFLPNPKEPVLVIAHGWNNDHGDMYFGMLDEIKGSPDGSDNFWGIPTPDSEWTLWSWSYFKKPQVTYWRTLCRLPKGGKRHESNQKADD